MARVTVEDCVNLVSNPFELVVLTAHRTREISSGSPITVERHNDKNPVISLREIAEETQSADDLRERLIECYQTQIEVDEPEEDAIDLMRDVGFSAGANGDSPRSDKMDEESVLRELMAAQREG